MRDEMRPEGRRIDARTGGRESRKQCVGWGVPQAQSTTSTPQQHKHTTPHTTPHHHNKQQTITNNKQQYPVILFLVFNVADLIGKVAPHWGLKPSQGWLLAWCCARVAFFPAFFCAARFHAPPVAVCLLTLALGLSNG